MENADLVLAIPLTEPERIFSKHTIKEQRIALLKIWHPDINKDPKAGHVCAHVNRLAEAAEDKVARGTWHRPGVLELEAKNGKLYVIQYKREHDIAIGKMYVGRNAVTYVVDNAYADLVDHAAKMIERIPYRDDKIRKQIAPFLPQVIGHLVTTEAKGFALRKGEDVLLLKDVLSYSGGKIDPRHVAWMISSLLNLACYMQVHGLVLPALGPDTVFIDPADHTVHLLGGWWYAVQANQNLSALPARTVANLPKSMLKDRVGTNRMNLELIKVTGRELLGDVTGTKLRLDKEVPTALSDWLMLPSGDDAITEYRAWRDQVLTNSFGERRFVKLSLTHNELYS